MKVDCVTKKRRSKTIMFIMFQDSLVLLLHQFYKIIMETFWNIVKTSLNAIKHNKHFERTKETKRVS